MTRLRTKCEMAVAWSVGVAVVVCPTTGWGGIFDRVSASDLRVATWNIYNDSVFSSSTSSTSRYAKLGRVAASMQPDVWLFQEVYNTSTPSILTTLNTLQPLNGGLSWNVSRSGENVVASRYPILLSRTTPSVSGRTSRAALVDLPDALFPTDLFAVSAHFKCCSDGNGANEALRRAEADTIVAFLKDAREVGGNFTLPAKTALLVGGDLNIVEGPRPIETLTTGDITNNAIFGPDSAPDWDGTALIDVQPRHNGTSTTDWTWRSDGSGFAPGRLDYVLVSDSVLSTTRSFGLNTTLLSDAELTANGLQRFDVTLDQVGSDFDHIPLFVDFKAVPEPRLVLCFLPFVALMGRRR